MRIGLVLGSTSMRLVGAAVMDSLSVRNSTAPTDVPVKGGEMTATSRDMQNEGEARLCKFHGKIPDLPDIYSAHVMRRSLCQRRQS